VLTIVRLCAAYLWREFRARPAQTANALDAFAARASPYSIQLGQMTEAAQTETQTQQPVPDKPEKPPKPLAKEVIEELMIMWREKVPRILRLLN
jgi:hypothetical protein